jgi:hypothetical protein
LARFLQNKKPFRVFIWETAAPRLGDFVALNCTGRWDFAASLGHRLLNILYVQQKKSSIA